MQSKPRGYLTLSAAAEILDCSKLEVKALINSGKFRSKTAPFRSNLHDMDTLKTYVHTQDVRDFLISLKALAPEAPVTDEEALIIFANNILAYLKTRAGQ